VNLPRALAHLQRRLALPTYDTARAIDALLAARLTAYLKGSAKELLAPSPALARRSLDLGRSDAKAPGAAPGREAGAHKPRATPPFEARTAARVRLSGEGGRR